MKKTISTPALTLLGTTLLLGIANAQTTDIPQTPPDDAAANNTMASDTKVTGIKDKSMTTSDADRQFMIETAQGSAHDRATAELAVQKSQNKNVQRYALRLMDAHSKLNKRLLMQANTRGLELPLTTSNEDQTRLQTLMDISATNEFDLAYLKEAVDTNAADVRKGNEAINASKDAKFRALMRDYVNTEQNHLNEASKIFSALQKQDGTMPRGIMNAPTPTAADDPNAAMDEPATTK